jgi:hypothetical protein
MLTAPRPSFSVQAPSHSRSCGQILPQGIGLMRKLRRLEQLAGIDQREPIRNVVVDRAFPFAERITAGQTPAGLLCSALAVVLRIDLAKMPRARLDVELVGVAARDIQKLQVLVGHEMRRRAARQAARRRLTSSEAMAAAFGFTTQNFPM